MPGRSGAVGISFVHKDFAECGAGRSSPLGLSGLDGLIEGAACSAYILLIQQHRREQRRGPRSNLRILAVRRTPVGRPRLADLAGGPEHVGQTHRSVRVAGPVRVTDPSPSQASTGRVPSVMQQVAQQDCGFLTGVGLGEGHRALVRLAGRSQLALPLQQFAEYDRRLRRVHRVIAARGCLVERSRSVNVTAADDQSSEFHRCTRCVLGMCGVNRVPIGLGGRLSIPGLC